MAASSPALARKPAREPLLTGPFLLAWLAQFTHALGMDTQVHLPGFFQALGASKVAVGALALALALAAILARPFTGDLMDRVGRRKMLISGGILHIAVSAGYLTVSVIGPWLVALRAAQGLVEALLFAGMMTYAADIIPASRRTQGLAWFGLGGLVPVALGGLLGDAVLATGDYADLFWVMTGLATLGLLFTLPLPEPVRPVHAEPTRGFLAALRQPNLLPIWFVGCVFATSLTAILVFLKSYVIDTGIGSVGLFLSGYVVCATILRLGFGWVPDRVGQRLVLVPALFAIAAGLFLLSFATNSTDLAIAGSFCGLGHGIAFPTGMSLTVTRARASERGAAVSIYTAIFPMGMLLGPAFGAIIEYGGYGAAFATAGTISVLGAVVFYLWDRRLPELPVATAQATTAELGEGTGT